jgi:hypothetical protein
MKTQSIELEHPQDNTKKERKEMVKKKKIERKIMLHACTQLKKVIENTSVKDICSSRYCLIRRKENCSKEYSQ